jgi:hypothetical protein
MVAGDTSPLSYKLLWTAGDTSPLSYKLLWTAGVSSPPHEKRSVMGEITLLYFLPQYRYQDSKLIAPVLCFE